MANGVSMIRVLFFCEFGIRNGGENSLLAVLPHLMQMGVEPIVAAPSPSEVAQQLQISNISTQCLKWGEFPINPVFDGIMKA